MTNTMNPSTAVLPRAAASAAALVAAGNNGVGNAGVLMPFVPSWAHVSTPVVGIRNDRAAIATGLTEGNDAVDYRVTSSQITSSAAVAKQGAPPRGEPR